MESKLKEECMYWAGEERRVTQRRASDIVAKSQAGEITTLTAECERLAEVRNAAGSVGEDDLLGAIARGWCAKPNAGKVMDEQLAFAICLEVQALLDSRAPAAATIEQQTAQGMAECMDAVRATLIDLGVIGKDVAPMFIAEAVASHIKGMSASAPSVERNAEELLSEADELLGIAWAAAGKAGLSGKGSDCGLPHELRMFALHFYADERDGPGALQVKGDGRFLKWRRAIRAIKSAAPAKPEPAVQACAVPKGWKLVPIVPTEAMILAAANVDDERESTWAAYLAAAPVAQPLAPSGAVPEIVNRTSPIIQRGRFIGRGGIPDGWTMGAYQAEQPAGMELAEHGVVIVAGKYSAELTAERRAAMGFDSLAAQPLAGQDVRAVTDWEIIEALWEKTGRQWRPTGIDLDDTCGYFYTYGQLVDAFRKVYALAAPSPVNPKQEQKP